MILDAEAQILTATGFDLEAVRPGPGKPIKLFGTGLVADTDLIINHGETQALAEGGLTHCITVRVPADGQIEFELPSSTLQWIAGVITTGELHVVLDGQTNL